MNRKVEIEMEITTTIGELIKLFNEDMDKEEFEEWVENDISPLNIATLIDHKGFKALKDARILYVDIEGND